MSGERKLVRLFAGSPVSDVYFDPNRGRIIHRVELRSDSNTRYDYYYAVYDGYQTNATEAVFEGLRTEIDRLLAETPWERPGESARQYQNAVVELVEELAELSDPSLDYRTEKAIEHALVSGEAVGSPKFGVSSRRAATHALYRFRDCGYPIAVGQKVRDVEEALSNVDVLLLEYDNYENYKPLDKVTARILEDSKQQVSADAVARAVEAVKSSYRSNIASGLDSAEQKLHAINKIYATTTLLAKRFEGNVDRLKRDENGAIVGKEVEQRAANLEPSEESTFYDEVHDFLRTERSKFLDEYKENQFAEIKGDVSDDIEEIARTTGEPRETVADEVSPWLSSFRTPPRSWEVGSWRFKLPTRRQATWRISLLAFGVWFGYKFTQEIEIVDEFFEGLLGDYLRLLLGGGTGQLVAVTATVVAVAGLLAGALRVTEHTIPVPVDRSSLDPRAPAARLRQSVGAISLSVSRNQMVFVGIVVVTSAVGGGVFLTSPGPSAFAPAADETPTSTEAASGPPTATPNGTATPADTATSTQTSTPTPTPTPTPASTLTPMLTVKVNGTSLGQPGRFTVFGTTSAPNVTIKVLATNSSKIYRDKSSMVTNGTYEETFENLSLGNYTVEVVAENGSREATENVNVSLTENVTEDLRPAVGEQEFGIRRTGPSAAVAPHGTAVDSFGSSNEAGTVAGTLRRNLRRLTTAGTGGLP